MYFDQSGFDIRCEWGLAAVENVSQGSAVVVVDVLSFTTCVDVALSRGATIFPYRYKDETAGEYAKSQNATLAARSRSVETYSLSPSSLMNARPGLKLVLPSPNGAAIAVEACNRNAFVAAGSLRNAAEVAATIQELGRPITVIPAGERWPDGSLRPALEDLIGAGAIIFNLRGNLSPEATAAAAVFESTSSRLLEQISGCSSGRELIELGFGCDVEVACDLDSSRTVPVLEDACFVDIARGR